MNSCPFHNIKLTLTNISVSLDALEVLKNISIEVNAGEYVSIVGPSGCGKSTLFNIISGLIKPDNGRVIIDQADCTGKTGFVGYMQQKDLLLPWFTIVENISLPLRIHGLSKQEARKKVLEEIPIFGLEGFEDRYPIELSGGMRQKAALLRTILFEKEIILLDEPFGRLDAITRKKMQNWLMKLKNHFNKTILMITHDVDEAIYLSDSVYLFSNLPGTILDSFSINLPKPRELSIQTSSPFNAYKKRIMEKL